jgi:hypothetical protein
MFMEGTLWMRRHCCLLSTLTRKENKTVKTSHCVVLGVLALPLLFAGCTGEAPKGSVEKPDAMKSKGAGVNSPSMTRDDESTARAALAKLSAEDRQLAEAQGVCPKSGQPLGSMGVPIKVMLKGQPVFLCCEGCEDDARQHADQMLAKVEQLKAKAEGLPAGR